MTTDEFKRLREYANQKAGKAGIRMNHYSKHVYSVLRFCETEAQIDETIAAIVRNKPLWVKV
jgi:hypothetical protein